MPGGRMARGITAVAQPPDFGLGLVYPKSGDFGYQCDFGYQ